jgi:hypothetical protein
LDRSLSVTKETYSRLHQGTDIKMITLHYHIS